MPTRMISGVAYSTSSRVTGKNCLKPSITGESAVTEKPKSPRNILPIQRKYCTGAGSVRPYFWIMDSTWLGGIFSLDT